MFERQEIRDDKLDWMDILTGDTLETKMFVGPVHIDIRSINSLSDGNDLNATFWLGSISEPFEYKYVTSEIKQLYYGSR
ncbi:hypothetical protein [Candidatus Nitrosocosmicus franklandus]|uniref:Uncharacterized protein n=1 Tax=Candidatus Nitrosocosmicus franklandianus TaxID=1798806 RepID=A0A484IA89_9ARCH|nr:hypothetical protein [Candidatus Nitrosocosmicus franklandus]VFJ12935.1 protein of unknown function [Candidatus Nitrosocosmicus franklandus]